MEKVLKKYTTIPQHLYVERYADNQLKRIIEEMQRPGYVLVARQMGKTNLLFNAKRTLENSNRLFAYVDLSNLYNNERDCYRNIINCIIEPNLNIFEKIEDEIEQIREKELPPHNEYSRSLTKILNYFPGDLVIILDEIDALKSVGYSDNIFAQIRSNYFSRTNYPVLERLTYVLSGVIEPTELIKDKNKSPFNIGDKIYLDDFTKEEHDNFIVKSKLEIPNSISDEIFCWTNGNPRLTFDICAEIENYLINNGEVNTSILENIINKKYLTSYDIAPIDHIRELTKSNRDIRKAILNINNQNSIDISDDLKKKLYLYGIINSKFNEVTKIKNRIIELSLTNEWIKSIDKDKEVSFVYGLAKYDEKDYEGAIEVFKEVLSTTLSERDYEATNYFLGMAYLKIENYQEAITFFSHPFKETSFKNDGLAFLGVCQIALNDDQALLTLEKAIEIETNTHAYHNALLNLAINISDDKKSIELLEKLYKSTYKSEDEAKDELVQLRALSLYYQADILYKNEDRLLASKKIEQALEQCSLLDSLFLLFYKNLLNNNDDESVGNRIVNSIIDNQLQFQKGNSYPISFQEKHLYFYLDFIFKKDNNDLFERFLDYSIRELIPGIERYRIIYSVSQISIKNKEDILTYLLLFSDGIDSALLLDIYRDLLILYQDDHNSFLRDFDKYLVLFRELKVLTNKDIYLFTFCIKLYSDKKKIDEGISLCRLFIDEFTDFKNEDLKYEIVIIYYWYANLHFSNRDKNNAVKYADIALELIKEANGKKLSMIDEAGLKSVSTQLTRIKISSQVTNPILKPQKIGRNDKIKVKYKNGNVKEDKFKKLEADILAERCSIIE